MYTRSYQRQPRVYTPPPGYVGHVFPSDGEGGGIKHHLPDDEVTVTSVTRPDTDAECEECELRGDGEDALSCGKPQHVGGSEENPLGELLRALRGRIGREELIILLVMLLVASEGIGIELLLLAVVLISV